jgi:hypothetical protein
VETYKKNIKASQRFEYGIYQILDHFLGRKRVFKILGKRRRAFYGNLHETLKKSGEGKVIEIERRTDLSLKEFRKKYLRKGIPVIFEGGAKEWDCVKKWSFEYFKDLHGKDEIIMPDGKDYIKKMLTEVIDDVRSGSKTYYRFYPLLKRHPEHINDFDYKWLLTHKVRHLWFEVFRIFMGAKETTTHLHNENTANLFVQVYGEKKWILYPPYYSAVIDPNSANVYREAPKKTEQDRFSPFTPDYNYPYTLYKYIDRYETVLKPGDILWNPPFYWHTVKNASDSIGVGYRWFSPSTAFRMAPLYMFLDLFTINPPIWKLYKLSKDDYNLYALARIHKLDKNKKTTFQKN